MYKDISVLSSISTWGWMLTEETRGDGNADGEEEKAQLRVMDGGEFKIAAIGWDSDCRRVLNCSARSRLLKGPRPLGCEIQGRVLAS